MGLLKNVFFVLFITCLLSINFAPSNAVAFTKENVEVFDPLESVNRGIYGFNRFVDKILLKPIAKTYKFVVPKPARKGIRNALRNLTEPVTLLNSALQGDGKHSVTTLSRFAINSTFGFLGVFEIANSLDLQHRNEDFGQTVGYYGINHGPYLMLPILGPSNTRDLLGRVVDSFSDPFNYAHEDFVLARTITNGIDARERALNLIDEIDRVSLDPYAATRSLYTQRRNNDIMNGASTNVSQ